MALIHPAGYGEIKRPWCCDRTGDCLPEWWQGAVCVCGRVRLRDTKAVATVISKPTRVTKRKRKTRETYAPEHSAAPVSGREITARRVPWVDYE